MEADVLLPTEAIRRWVYALWRTAGSAEEEAQRTADHLIGANLAGHDSHGVGMVAPYVRSLQAGELQLNQRLSLQSQVQAPAGVLIDHEGKPTINPAVMYEEPLGALLTAAGHKGYALAMVCDLLGSALFGGFTPQPSRLRAPGLYNNMLAIVFDPARFGAGEHFEQEANAFIEYVQSAKRTDAGAPIEVPGDAERRFRVERAQALPVDAGTLRTLDEAARAINTLRGATLAPASALVAC